MNLRDLKYLVAVADVKHFGQAAEHCHVSQPTLSMQLKKLEDFLGVVLIERGKKQAMLTPAGVAIVAKARDILLKSEQLIATAKENNDPLGGELRLGAFPTLAPYLFPLIMPKITASFPKLRLLLIEEKTAELVAQLKEGKIDAALIALPVEGPGIEAQFVFSEPFLLATPRGHTLAKKKTVTVNDVAAQQLLLLDEGHCLRDQALEFCHRVGSKETDNFRATSLETLRQMVASGAAITLMPQLAIEKKKGPISYIPFKNQQPVRKIAFCTRAHFPRTELKLKLATLIRRETALYL